VAARPITFLSDYGADDEFAGVCRAVIARVAPEARVIDLTHGVPRHDVRRGAIALADSLPYAPAGVHLAVVDPGVGTERRPVAVRIATEDRVLVGPDNGLMWPAIEELGGPVEAVELSGSRFRLEPVSATFHGRDVFAPVAAAIALGAALADAGNAIEPGSLSRLVLPAARPEGGGLTVTVLYVDGYGNAALNARAEDLVAAELPPDRPLAVAIGGSRHEARLGRTFGDAAVGRLVVYEDSSRRLALAVNRGSASEALGLRPGDELVLRPADDGAEQSRRSPRVRSD
jgi:S-adenosyl-L-methionine hydrolase (adenosine-forming)